MKKPTLFLSDFEKMAKGLFLEPGLDWWKLGPIWSIYPIIWCYTPIWPIFSQFGPIWPIFTDLTIFAGKKCFFQFWNVITPFIFERQPPVSKITGALNLVFHKSKIIPVVSFRNNGVLESCRAVSKITVFFYFQKK